MVHHSLPSCRKDPSRIVLRSGCHCGNPERLRDESQRPDLCKSTDTCQPQDFPYGVGLTGPPLARAAGFHGPLPRGPGPSEGAHFTPAERSVRSYGEVLSKGDQTHKGRSAEPRIHGPAFAARGIVGVVQHADDDRDIMLAHRDDKATHGQLALGEVHLAAEPDLHWSDPVGAQAAHVVFEPRTRHADSVLGSLDLPGIAPPLGPLGQALLALTHRELAVNLLVGEAARDRPAHAVARAFFVASRRAAADVDNDLHARP
jgi:hypothetical protein